MPASSTLLQPASARGHWYPHFLCPQSAQPPASQSRLPDKLPKTPFMWWPHVNLSYTASRLSHKNPPDANATDFVGNLGKGLHYRHPEQLPGWHSSGIVVKVNLSWGSRVSGDRTAQFTLTRCTVTLQYNTTRSCQRKAPFEHKKIKVKGPHLLDLIRIQFCCRGLRWPKRRLCAWILKSAMRYSQMIKIRSSPQKETGDSSTCHQGTTHQLCWALALSPASVACGVVA